jgi:hypothetical protein
MGAQGINVGDQLAFTITTGYLEGCPVINHIRRCRPLKKFNVS